MNKVFVFLVLIFGFSIGLHSKCINIIHQKEREILVEGGMKKNTKEYQCLIKALESGVFDNNGNCKFCGCNVINHDNT